MIKKSIGTFIHPSNDLYGSDKMLLIIVDSVIKNKLFDKINVILPYDGPLTKLLSDRNVNVIIHPLSILRKSDIKKFNFSFLLQFIRNKKFCFKYFKESDLIYINTLVVFDFIIYSRYFHSKKVIHIHEIPTGIAKILFLTILKFSLTPLIHISKAVFSNFSKMNLRHFILPNGCEPISENLLKTNIYERKLNILLIGRLNSWKGHRILIEAISLLDDKSKKDINVRIVGSVYDNQIKYKLNLVNYIYKKNVSSIVEILPFTEEPSIYYNWSDIVIIPSTNPEPFGLVAIESMSIGKLVIASNHGGLSEIISNEIDGLLFKPKDSDELSQLIKYINVNRYLLEFYNVNAKKKYIDKYTTDVFSSQLHNIITRL